MVCMAGNSLALTVAWCSCLPRAYAGATTTSTARATPATDAATTGRRRSTPTTPAMPVASTSIRAAYIHDSYNYKWTPWNPKLSWNSFKDKDINLLRNFLVSGYEKKVFFKYFAKQ